MPIYDFQCRQCGHVFEAVVRHEDTPECPACRSQRLERLLSSFAVSTPELRQRSADRSRRKAAADARRDNFERDRESEKHRREEH